MTKAIVTCGAIVTAVIALAFASLAFYPSWLQGGDSVATPSASDPSTPGEEESRPGFLYGRITTIDGGTYEGRLRWGRDQEAFWDDYFNGSKAENPYAMHAPLVERPEARSPIKIFGFEIGGGDEEVNLRRPFMARFGDIARIVAHVGDVQVTLKNGTVFSLDRFAAGDIDDGVRVWDRTRGVVDLNARRVSTIEFLPTAPLTAAPVRLHGTVQTSQGNFTGFIQWQRHDGLGSDELEGRSADGPLRLRYDTIRAIARQSPESSRVTLLDGRELVLLGTSDSGDGNPAIYVHDARYGRVLVSWSVFERLDFIAGGSGPAYGEFLPGRALTGSVTTRNGRRLTGRLVYDFDEAATTETLDASVEGVDYTIHFSVVTSIVLHGRGERGTRGASVVLHGDDELQLEPTGDLGEGHAGMLVFVSGTASPVYVPWTDVDRIDFDQASAMSPPLGPR